MLALACANAKILPRHPRNDFSGWNQSSLVTLKSFSLEHHRTQCSTSTDWSTDLSTALYKIDGWGVPYFYINKTGNISIRPHGITTPPHKEIDLMKVVQEATGSKASGGLGLQMPLIVRFPEVLKHRLEFLNSAFEFAIRAHEYGSHYQGVYPVKCNQDRYIVEDLVEFGAPFRFGLEVGSKPELLLAMSYLLKGSRDAFLICNGYKDQEYVSLAINAHIMGLNIVIVLEQEEELDMVIETSRRFGVRPIIGLRAKLRTKHSGHFGSTSGENGKFGLTTAQILRVVSKLKQLEMLDCLQLLHFHMGSQIPSIALLAEGVREAAHIYCEMTRLGASMRIIDVGGGLGVDYDGTNSSGSDLSVGYGLEEYATTVVQAIQFACDQKGVKHPILCSESGRALVSHHSVLIFEAFSTSQPISFELDRNLVYHLDQLTDDARADYRNLMASVMNADCDKCNIYADQLKKSCVDQFKDGMIGLELLAAVDGFCNLVAQGTRAAKPIHTYHVNLSLFTSIPDFWAIGQLFPILPIHRLIEHPGVDGMLLDLTCDSDGKINRFITGQSTLPLHEINTNWDCKGRYYLGMFLGGAYQEALGGVHNLFGRPNIIRVSQSDAPHNFTITKALSGPSCADVLRAMHHEPRLMFEALKHRIEEYGLDVSKTCAISNAFSSMPYLVSQTSIGEDGTRSGQKLSSGTVTKERSAFQDDEEAEVMWC